jgi:RNA 2',3'-cyclic 3'-phosphodiesterase
LRVLVPEQAIRTFVAAEVPDAVKAAVRAATEPLRDRHARGVRWTSSDSWHLTLKFLGEIDVALVNSVAEATRAVCDEMLPFDMSIVGWGAFPRPEAPRVIWAGAGDGTEEFVTAAKRLDSLLVGQGFEREKKSVRPHITVARVKDANAGAEAFAALRQRTLRETTFTIDKLILFRSILDPQGARYHHLAECSPAGS